MFGLLNFQIQKMSKIRIIGLLFSIFIFVFFIFDGQNAVSVMEIYLSNLYNQPMEWGTSKYPTSFQNISIILTNSYKWVLNVFRFCGFILSTLVFIICLFPYKNIFFSLLFTYLFILFVCICFLLFGLTFHKYSVGFANIHYFKRLVQSPMIALFFSIYYWKIQPASGNKII